MSDSPEQQPPTDTPAAEPPSSAPPPPGPTDATTPGATPTGDQDSTPASTPTPPPAPAGDPDSTPASTPTPPPPPAGAEPPSGPAPTAPGWQSAPPPPAGAVPPAGPVPGPTPPGWDPHRPPAWGPPGPGGSERSPTGAGTIGTLLGSAITLGLGAVAAIGLLLTSDMPDSYLSDDFFLTMVAMLAAAAAPVALLLAWDEFDLSGFGAAALGSYLYVEVGDGTVVLGLFAAAVAGLACGAAVGVVRWLTGAHSALVTFGAGIILAGFAQWMGPGPSGVSARDGRITDAGLPFLTMLVVVGVAVLLAVLFRRDDEPSAPVPGTPGAPGAPVGPGVAYAPAPATAGRAPGLAGPRVIPGFALSVMGAALFGAFQAGTLGYYGMGYFPFVPILVFAAVAVGGVVRGSGFLAPLTATVAAGMVIIIQDATRFHGWEPGSQELLLGVLIVVCASLTYGLRRIMRPAARPGPAPGSAF